MLAFFVPSFAATAAEVEPLDAAAMRTRLFAAGERTRMTDIDRAVFLLVNAVPSVVRAAIQADPQGQADDRLKPRRPRSACAGAIG